ncbi:protein root UVB sensitive 6 [Tanacetum coccineum]
MKFTRRPSTPSSSQDAHLLVRETLRISANLASSPAPQDAIKRVEDDEFVDASLRLICYEEVDGRRFKYLRNASFIRAVSLQSRQAPVDELVSFIRSYVVPEGFPDSVSPSYVPYMTWRALKHFFGGAMGVFTTQALLHSVGVSQSQAMPGAVAINWIIKDGSGRIGKIQLSTMECD